MFGRSNSIMEYDLLDEEQCAAVLKVIYSLRESWTLRAGENFFTLGACVYLDAVASREVYFERSGITNSILCAHFATLLERVRLFIQGVVKEDAFFDDRYAVPGFHIFAANGEDRCYSDVAASAHFDMQGQQVMPESGPFQTLTFTLPLEIPVGGASLEIWPINLDDFSRLRVSIQNFTARCSSQVIAYRCGRVVLHDGLILHALGRAPGENPRGMRITLQGHGVRLPRGWMIYW